MKVLVAGLTKTGTKTMAAALTILGYEVYDWAENFYYLGDEWQRQIQDGFKVEDIRRMYENVDAVMDGPCDVYWEEIFEAFPDVKVILTVRNEESWVKSLKNQVYQLNTDVRYRLARTITYTGAKAQSHLALSGPHLARFQSWPRTKSTPLHDEALKSFKRRHERNVKQIVPKKQLLVYDVKEGWKQLCDFLDVPAPNLPFPHKNKGATVFDEMRKENLVMQRIETELNISLVLLFVLLGIIIYKVTQFDCLYN